MTIVLPRFSAGLTLYPWQEEALSRWEEAGHRGTMKVVTGAGKTVLGLAAIDRLMERDPELRVAIVVPTIVLQRQWLKELKDRADSALPARSIGLMGGGKSERFNASRRIVISVLNSASQHLAADVAQAEVSEHLLLIVDEVHRSGAKIMSQIFRTERSYSLGLSATPERMEADDGDQDSAPGSYDESLLGREVGPIVYELTLAQAIDQGVLPPFSINHYGVSLSPTERGKYDSLSQSIKDAREQLEGLLSNRGRSTSGLLPFAQSLAASDGPHAGTARRFIAESQERKRLLYRATARSAAVGRILRRELEHNANARALLFHESIEKVTELAHLLEASFPGLVGIEHSKLSDRQRAETIESFRDGRIQLLVSVRSLIEGFNVPAADVGVIVASSSSVRQRVQSLGRLLRKHSVSGAEEKHSVMHVIYVRDTVDDAIYAQEDWEAITGVERNAFYHYLPPDEPAVRDGPPRRPRPTDTEISPDLLRPGEEYAGRYQGTEFTADTQGNITTLDGHSVNAPAELWSQVTSVKGSAGRFVVSPGRNHVVVRVRDDDGWVTRFVTQLDEPLGARDAPQAVAGYTGPTDADGGEYSIKRSAGGLRIARPTAHGRGLQFAKAGVATDAITRAVERIQSRGPTISRFRINSRGDAITRVGGSWMLVTEGGNDLEF